MIAVDTNVIASLLLPTSQHTDAAMRLLETDRQWVAPVLWRSEFCNILVTSVRRNRMTHEQAAEALASAEELMDAGEFRVPTAEVLKTAIKCQCTGYDCEFVVLAKDLGIKLVTLDRAILAAFPDLSESLSTYGPAGAA